MQGSSFYSWINLNRYFQKRNNIQWVFLLCLTLSCSKSIDISNNDNGLTLRTNALYIEETEDIPWRVGRGGKKVDISKGIRITLSIPLLKGDDNRTVQDVYDADSWFFQVDQLTLSGRSSNIGNFIIFLPPKSKSSFSLSTRMNANLYLRYAAVSPSRRFENFECPAFDHNKKPKDIEIIEESSDELNFILILNSTGTHITYQQAQSIGTPVTFNAGPTLAGTFRFKVGLYNSSERVLISSLIPLNEIISIPNEETVNIPGCADFEVPENRYQGVDKMQRFKFKR